MSAPRSPELQDLAGVMRAFLEEHAPLARTRTLMATSHGHEPEVWRRMADELGLHGLTVPERFGGLGYGGAELAVILEEMGAELYGGPYFSTVALAVNVLLASGDDAACERYLPRIAAGELTATVAFAQDGVSRSGQVVASPSAPPAYSLSGDVGYVLDGGSADLLLIQAGPPDSSSLFACERVAGGVTSEPVPTMDQTRKFANVALCSAPGIPVGELGSAALALAPALDNGAVALAAEQVGGTRTCLEMSTEYATSRVQFGRPIGSYQAIKHRCADMLIGLVQARSVMEHAANACDDRGELRIAARVAKSLCSDVFYRAARDTVQIHGGIGFTWEHDAHLYLKRAKSSQLFLGHPDLHRDQLGQRLGI